MKIRSPWLPAIVFLTLSLGRAANAETRHYVLAIGNNQAPATAGDAKDDELSTLHYADDDAASVVAFGRELGAETSLLTVLDSDSERRFPGMAREARPPTLAELRRVAGIYKKRFEADLSEGNEPELIFYYSGHGVLRAGAAPSLSMLDGPLTRAVLYDEILSALPARYVHVIVDACHAEAVIRPRDAQAEVAELTDDELHDYAARSTLRRFPNVGAVVATAAAAEAHEWDVYQRGIFTYQVLSALRGAADVNGDGLVEYSELFAFLGSANAGVADPRARLSVVVRPPAVNLRAPIADLSAMRHRSAALTGVGPGVGRFFVEDEQGNRLGEMLPEPGFHFQLLVPSGKLLYVRTASSEGSVRLEPGDRLMLSSLALRSGGYRARGAAEMSLRRGLFATPFGPTYYRGFVDARPEIAAVQVDGAGSLVESTIDRGRTSARTAGIALLAGSGVLAGTAVVMSLLAAQAQSDFNATNLERSAWDARDRFVTDRAVAWGAGLGAVITGALGAWFIVDSNRAPAVSWAAGPDGIRITGKMSW
jgi:hypothetical protein